MSHPNVLRSEPGGCPGPGPGSSPPPGPDPVASCCGQVYATLHTYGPCVVCFWPLKAGPLEQDPVVTAVTMPQHTPGTSTTFVGTLSRNQYCAAHHNLVTTASCRAITSAPCPSIAAELRTDSGTLLRLRGATAGAAKTFAERGTAPNGAVLCAIL